MKQVLITGGSGLIGHALSLALVQSGYAIWSLTRRPESADFPAGVRPLKWDGRTADGWSELAGQADAIIHLAGENIGARPWTNERKRLIRASRVDSGRAVVSAVEQAVSQSRNKPAAVLQIAGVGIYGSGNQPVDETSPAGNDFLAGVAADWERSTQPVAALGVRHVVMRTGVVLSKKGGVLEPFRLQNRLFAGGPIGSGRQWISWIHLDDLVRSIVFLLEQDNAQGVYNLTSPQPVTNAEFGRTVSRVMRRPYWLPTPAFMLRLVLGEMSTLVLEGQRVLPRRLLENGFSFQFGDLQKALEDLI